MPSCLTPGVLDVVCSVGKPVTNARKDSKRAVGSTFNNLGSGPVVESWIMLCTKNLENTLRPFKQRKRRILTNE